MNKMSSSLLIFWVKFVVSVAVGGMFGISSVRDVQAHNAGAAAARPAQRRTRQHLDEKPARPIMGILLQNRGRTGGEQTNGGRDARGAKLRDYRDGLRGLQSCITGPDGTVISNL